MTELPPPRKTKTVDDLLLEIVCGMDRLVGAMVSLRERIEQLEGKKQISKLEMN